MFGLETEVFPTPWSYVTSVAPMPEELTESLRRTIIHNSSLLTTHSSWWSKKLITKTELWGTNFVLCFFFTLHKFATGCINRRKERKLERTAVDQNNQIFCSFQTRYSRCALIYSARYIRAIDKLPRPHKTCTSKYDIHVYITASYINVFINI